jgi:hypothetical protein
MRVSQGFDAERVLAETPEFGALRNLVVRCAI